MEGLELRLDVGARRLAGAEESALRYAAAGLRRELRRKVRRQIEPGLACHGLGAPRRVFLGDIDRDRLRLVGHIGLGAGRGGTLAGEPRFVGKGLKELLDRRGRGGGGAQRDVVRLVGVERAQLQALQRALPGGDEVAAVEAQKVRVERRILRRQRLLLAGFAEDPALAVDLFGDRAEAAEEGCLEAVIGEEAGHADAFESPRPSRPRRRARHPGRRAKATTQSRCEVPRACDFRSS